MVGAVLQRSAGLGLALILAPVCVAVIGPAGGVMLVNELALASSLFIIPGVWADIDWRRIIPLLLAAIPGALLGTFLVVVLNTDWLEVVVGLSLLLGLFVTIFLPAAHEPRELPTTRFLLGAAAGTVSTAAGSGGPVILMYASLAGWPFRVLRASVQPYYFGIAFIALSVKTIVQPEDFPSFDLLGWVLIYGCLFGSILMGNFVAQWLPTSFARSAAYVLATVGAIVTVVRGIFGIIAG